MNFKKIIEETVCLFFIFAFGYFLLMLGSVLGLS
jgi:hypothetical protein